MIKISQILWDADSIYHIAKHNVTPEEVEEAVFEGDKVILRGRETRYVLLSRSSAGRYLTIVAVFKMKGRVRLVTARDMSTKEKTYYRRTCR